MPLEFRRSFEWTGRAELRAISQLIRLKYSPCLAGKVKFNNQIKFKLRIFLTWTNWKKYLLECVLFDFVANYNELCTFQTWSIPGAELNISVLLFVSPSVYWWLCVAHGTAHQWPTPPSDRTLWGGGASDAGQDGADSDRDHWSNFLVWLASGWMIHFIFWNQCPLVRKSLNKITVNIIFA